MKWREWLDACGDALNDAADRVLDLGKGAVEVLGIVARAFWQASPEFKLKALGFLLGIPLSYESYLWMTYKPAKQMVDCRNDLYTDAGITTGTPREQLDQIQAAGDRFFACQQGVDARIGSVEFIEQQHDRWRGGKL